MHRIGLRKTAGCPYCGAKKETLEHILWHCPAFEEQRKHYKEKYSETREMPNATLLAGLILDDKGLDDFFARLATEEEEGDAEPRPPQVKQEDEEFVDFDEDGFLLVAGDGAAPDGQGDLRTRRAGYGLYYGKGHSHNCFAPVRGIRQNAQRAEVRAALRWIAWSWTKQAYITDSDQTFLGVRALLQGKRRKARSHRDLWRRIEAAVKAKGRDNFKVIKVKAHQKKKDIPNESEWEKKLREYNEGADEAAVKGANENRTLRPPGDLIRKRHLYVTQATEIQRMLLAVCVERARTQARLFGRTKQVGERIDEKVKKLEEEEEAQKELEGFQECEEEDFEDPFLHGGGVSEEEETRKEKSLQQLWNYRKKGSFEL